ncbi:hypothetical protein GOODEAATRI_009837, partial [Goodea atripinnis]
GELVALTTRFTDELMGQGLTKRILTLVSEMSVTREFERLQKERGLGSEKHRKEVSDLIKECRQALADSLFSWTCQSALTKDDTLALIVHLETVTAQADGSLDSVSLALVMALFYCLDVSFIEQGTEDREVHSRLMDSQPWKLPGLQAVCRLAWALALRALSQLPQGSALVEFTEADEALADQALLGDVFLFMKEGILGCDSFTQEEFYVKQLRNRADEDARLVHMSLQMDSELPSSLRKDLDHLMVLIGEFYSKDPFGLELGLEFWCPAESLQHTSLQGSYLGMALQRPPHKQSENARLALCEHPQWTPVVVMLGLLQCSVPPVLKAELLHSLAAFGKSPEVELNEIESSCEEYPLTRAFCHLIGTLVESSVPVNLGAGLRVPGFQPYLNFLRDSVFLPFPTRAYHHFIQETVELQGEQVPAHKPPGHSIMFHLLNDSPMLALCLSLLEEGVRQLDTYAAFPGEETRALAAKGIQVAQFSAAKEVMFMDLLRESQSSLLVSPLEQLFQGVSPQTRRADHIVNIARYLYHSSSNPEAAFQSAKILRRIAIYPNIQIRLVIYQLCASPDTSGPTMRYLRTSQDFLFSHLQHLPFILT